MVITILIMKVALGTMKIGMSTDRKQHEIFGAVVRMIPVDVMNMFGWQQGASDNARHYEPMLSDIPKFGGHRVVGGINRNIPPAIYRAATLPVTSLVALGSRDSLSHLAEFFTDGPPHFRRAHPDRMCPCVAPDIAGWLEVSSDRWYQRAAATLTQYWRKAAGIPDSLNALSLICRSITSHARQYITIRSNTQV